MDSTILILPYGDADNRINFTALAVADMHLHQWLDMASDQYFLNLDPEHRMGELTSIYEQCVLLKNDMLHVEAVDSNNNIAPDTNMHEGTAPINP